jgi:hypothetical protein
VIKPRSVLLVVLVVGSLSAAVACSRKPAPESGPASTTPAAAAPEAAASAPMERAVRTVAGEVAETMDVASYTYLRVKTLNGDVWVATAKTKVVVGEKVVVPLESEMQNFHSPSLKRDFASIYFVTGIRREGESAAPPMAQPAPPPMAVAHGMGSAPAAPQAPVKVEPVAPPAGGSSIADVWANRAKLAGKTVIVRGTVVKFNGGILDRNWLHLQDGSGKAADGTNDITVTTDAVAKVGDVVTVTGTVAVDKDFGSGYAYALMLEKAKIK